MKKRFLLVPLAMSAAAVWACSPVAQGTGDGDGDIIPGDGDIDPDTGDGDIDPGGGGGGGGTTDNALGIPTSEILTPKCSADCAGFSDPSNPEAPLVVVDDGVGADIQSTLDGGGTPDAFCVSEPATGTIFPAAWTRPRFNAAGQTGPAKITLSTPKMKHDFTYYAAKLPAVLPLGIWEEISLNVYNEDITYTIVSGGGQATGTFQVAPVATGGSMVFWGSTGTEPGTMTNALYGFGVGEEGVIQALTPGGIDGTSLANSANPRDGQEVDQPGDSTCVGCHSSSPDGKAVATTDHWPWNIRVSDIQPGATGLAPEFLSAAGALMIQMPWLGGSTFSVADWATDRRRMVTTWAKRTVDVNMSWEVWPGQDGYSFAETELLWMDLASAEAVQIDLRGLAPADYKNEGNLVQTDLATLKGTGWDIIARNGDANSPALPDWSRDGTQIVYTSTDAPRDGRIGGATVADIYRVPFAAGAGGDAVAIEGASSPEHFEYYADISPDDAFADTLVAFNRVDKFATQKGTDPLQHVYYRPDSDIYVTSAMGGTATRLVSNDAVCAGTTGQLYNSWAKWSPSSASDGTRTYYFLIFSSARNSPFEIARNNSGSVTSPASQLYMTTVIKEADGSITSGAAIYLWNQRNLVTGQGETATASELLTNNVTPAWDEFKIPPVPPILVK